MKFAIALLVLATSPIFAQSIPDAPSTVITRGTVPAANKPTFDRTAKILFIADIGARYFDAASTRYALGNPHVRESILPDCIANSSTNLVLFETGMLAVNYIGSRYLIKHHHPKLAKVWLAIDAGSVAATAGHNMTMR